MAINLGITFSSGRRNVAIVHITWKETELKTPSRFGTSKKRKHLEFGKDYAKERNLPNIKWRFQATDIAGIIFLINASWQ